MKLTKAIYFFSLLSLFSCGEPKADTETINTDSIPNPQTAIMKDQLDDNQSLKAELTAKKLNFEMNASKEKKEIYAEGIKAVIDENIVSNALQVGDIAPNFSLKNAEGKLVTLYDELKKGPIVLMWYRGGWCPYCNITLNHMQTALPEIKKHGGNLLALTPELPDSSISTKEKNELQFEVLSDINSEVAKSYRVLFTLTPEVAKIYEEGFGLSQYNGNKNNELPLAATYIIGIDTKIKYAFLDADYRNRAEPIQLIKELKILKK